MDRSTQDPASIADRAAIGLSGLCLLHCLAMPILLLSAPAIEGLADRHLHLEILAFVIPVSAYALAHGYWRHRVIGPVLAGIAGVALLVLGATWVHQHLGVAGDRLVTIAGSIVLAAAHWVNSRLARRHRVA